MAHKCRDNGTAYEVVGGKVRDNGTSYAISHGKINSSGTVYEIPFSSGTPVSELSVGSTVKMNVNGAATEFIVVHQGKPSSLYDDSCNGTWVLMKDVYERRAWHSSDSNIYKSSTIHTYLNGTFLNLLDAGIKAQIKTVKIPCGNGNGSGAVASGSSGLSAKIFLLSGYEVGWTQAKNPWLPIDGACLSYFSGSGNSNSNRIAYLNGTAGAWWLRSPLIDYTEFAWFVRNSGECYYYGTCVNPSGVRPALVLPSDACIDDSFNIIA
jgi:hypothetical protein